MDMEEFFIALLSIAAGAAGYLIITFWVQPILRYREIKYRVAADLVFFANAIELQKQDGTLREDTQQRKESNRRCASELKAIYSELPLWYRLLLKKREESPIEASKNLIGLSNSSDWREAEPFEKGARKNLGLPDKILNSVRPQDMDYEYNKKHVQVSVSAATILGTLLGLWIGRRVEAAGILETVGVIVLFLVSCIVVFPAIDRKLLPQKAERKNE